MPAIYCYMHRNDVITVLQRFGADPEVAFIVAGGEGRWRAVGSVEDLVDGEYLLWHIPGGALPLADADGRFRGSVVEDPWAGWREQRPGADSRVPFMDAPQVVRLSLWTAGSAFEFDPQHIKPHDYVGVPALAWIGSHWSPAPPATKRWWQRTRAWIQRIGTRVLGSVPVNSTDVPIWAFPEAWKALENGARTYQRRMRGAV